jgi:hypothetical protein
MSQLWGISEIFLEATKNTNSTYRLILCLIQGVPKKEDESITPLFIGRF